MYTIIATQPDTIFGVEKFRQFSHDLTIYYYIGLDRILHYLKGTVDLDLFYNYSAIISIIELMGFANSTYTDNSSDCHSTHSMTKILG